MKTKLFFTSCLLLLAISLLPSCGNKMDAPESTYTFKYEANDGTDQWDFTLFEFNDAGESIFQYNIPNIKKGFYKQYVASPDATKIKIMILISNNLLFSGSYWVQTVYYLKSGQNIDIVFTGSTVFAKPEP